jgi:hypothetical protein
MQRVQEAGETASEIVASEHPSWQARRAAAVPQRTILGSFEEEAN